MSVRPKYDIFVLQISYSLSHLPIAAMFNYVSGKSNYRGVNKNSLIVIFVARAGKFGLSRPYYENNYYSMCMKSGAFHGIFDGRQWLISEQYKRGTEAG